MDNHQHYRKILFNSSAGYAYNRLILNSKGKAVDYEFLEVNKAYEQIVGVDAQDLISTRATKIFKGIEDGEFDWIGFYGSIVAGGGHMQVEQLFEPLHRWFKIEVIVIDSTHFVTLLTDTTKERQALAELKNFFDVNLDLLCIADTDGNFIRVNKAWEEVLGYSSKELESRKFLEFVHPDDLPSTQETITQLSRQQNILNFVNRYRCRDGSYRYIEWRSNPRGKRIYAAARDITERLQSEHKLEKLISISEDFLSKSTQQIDYQQVANHLLNLSEGKFAIFNLYNETLNELTTVACSGNSSAIERASALLGFKIVGRTWPIDTTRKERILAGQLTILPNIKALSKGFVSTSLTSVIEKSLGVGQVVIAIVAIEGKPIGDFVIFMPTGIPFAQAQQVELFLRQVGMLINASSAHKSLLESNELMSNLMRQVPGIIYQFRRWPNGDIDFPFVSQGIKDVYGVDPEQVKQDPKLMFSLIHPDDAKAVMHSIEQSFRSLGEWRIEGRIVLPSKEERWLSGRAKPEALPDGSVLWHGYIADITTHKIMEDELVREKNFANLVLNTMGQGVTVTNAKGEFEYVNPEFARMVGCKPENLIGNQPTNNVPPAYHPTILSARDEWQQGRVTTDELEIIHSSGRKVPVILTGVPIISNGEFSASIAVITDISNQKKVQEELRRVNSEKDKFFSIIAHDLKSPFSGFIGLTEMLSSNIDGLEKDVIQEVTSALKMTADGLYTLLENLLEWSKLQRGTATFNPKKLNLLGVVNSIIELLNQSAIAKEQVLKINIKKSTTLVADEQMVKSLLRNLISNAIKFTPKHGSIHITAKEQSDGIELSVTDTGIGIPKKMIPWLFDMTKKTSRKGTDGEESSGLGLLLCYEFAQMHGGSLSVDSQEGKGTTFTVFFPKINVS